MKHKSFFVFLCSLFLLSACNLNQNFHEHTYSEEWSYNENYHWRVATCDHHDLITDQGKHSFKVETVAATYTSAGYTISTCTVCGYSSRKELSQLAYDVRLNLNGGKSLTAILNQSVHSFNEIVFAFDATKDAYAFKGWSHYGVRLFDENGNKISNEPNMVSPMVFDACWEANQYSITYELNGGTNHQSNPNSYTVEDRIVFKNPTRKGFEFAGWYLDSGYSQLIEQLNGENLGDITLHAKWNIIKYSITYNLDGGTNSSNNPAEYTIESDIVLHDPRKNGYSFLGWQKEDGGSYVTNIPLGTTGDIVLNAIWSANKNVLSVVSQDISKGFVSIVSGVGYSDETIVVQATPLENCFFKGWFHDGEKISNEAILSFVMPPNDYSLIAHFFNAEEEQDEWNKLHGIVPVINQQTKTITYGLYPQELVLDSQLIDGLNKLDSTELNGWYKYNGDYYQRDFRNENVSYWYKCDVITWEIVNSNNSEAFLTSSVLLDCQPFSSFNYKTIDEQKIYGNNYKYSDVREWLNNDFYYTAFINNDYILITDVDNSLASTTTSTYVENPFICEDTQDYVFLMSNIEMGDYAHKKGQPYPSGCKVTAYAKSNGAVYGGLLTNANYYPEELWQNGYYWTRSPNRNQNGYCQVDCVTIDSGSEAIVPWANNVCVRPCITIKLY